MIVKIIETTDTWIPRVILLAELPPDRFRHRLGLLLRTHRSLKARLPLHLELLKNFIQQRRRPLLSSLTSSTPVGLLQPQIIRTMQPCRKSRLRTKHTSQFGFPSSRYLLQFLPIARPTPLLLPSTLAAHLVVALGGSAVALGPWGVGAAGWLFGEEGLLEILNQLLQNSLILVQVDFAYRATTATMHLIILGSVFCMISVRILEGWGGEVVGKLLVVCYTREHVVVHLGMKIKKIIPKSPRNKKTNYKKYIWLNNK